MKTYEIEQWGVNREVSLHCSNYANNGNLAIVVKYFDEDFECWMQYGVLTVNFEEGLPEGYAYVDTNNFPCAKELIGSGKIGEWTGKTRVSGWCSYPLYRFDVEKIKEGVA